MGEGVVLRGDEVEALAHRLMARVEQENDGAAP